jgi:teichuronic acid biosynthesis glycosyltransferase TuaG
MSPSLVSIITPAYRCAGVVGETIQSVLDQTYCDWEMLIAEDCSPDDTRAVVRDWTNRDARLRLIEMPCNGGPAAARNRALEVARGRWIAFLDSDDLWHREKLRRQIAFMEENKLPFTYTAFRRIKADCGNPGRLIEVPIKMAYRQLLGNTAIATSTVIINRDITGDFRMADAYYDDFVLWLQILKRGHVAHGLNDDLMRYRVMGGSVSRNKVKSARMVWQTYRRIEHLSAPVAALQFARYALNAWRKYRRF